MLPDKFDLPPHARFGVAQAGVEEWYDDWVQAQVQDVLRWCPQGSLSQLQNQSW